MLKKNYMLKNFHKLLVLLSSQDRKKILWLIFATIIMAFLETTGVASILPFLSIVSNPELIQTNEKIRWVYEQMGFTQSSDFLLALGSLVFIILVVSTIFRAFTAWWLLRFTLNKHYSLSRQLFSKYLYKPYPFFLDRNSSELISYLISEVSRSVSGVIMPCIQLFSKGLLVLAILSLLMAINPQIAVTIILILGISYILVYTLVKKKVSILGKEMVVSSRELYKAAGEAFGGIKDIKLLGKENEFIKRYSDPFQRNVKADALQQIISQVPQYIFEIIAIGGILLIVFYSIATQDNYLEIIPLLALYAFASYRIMPALHQIFQSVAMIRFSLPALDVVHRDLMSDFQSIDLIDIESREAMSFSKEIEFCNIEFQYQNTEELSINKLNLTIKTNSTVGIVGTTGAGKTTAIDLILGLLRPQHGELIIDGIEINEENLSSWQLNIGYVPQSIFLCDDSITRNIAFGVSDEEINFQAVEKAARLANIHEFIVNELPNGYETEVGERGVRISGGQRQRLGISRALYHDPSILILDEATSALDGITENVIMDAIHNLSHKKTIILVAHRFSTVKECDMIFMLESGRVIDQGTYSYLMQRNRQFSDMAKASII
jgi:ATP-binding cassette, subfamily B, bacterial PglK